MIRITGAALALALFALPLSLLSVRAVAMVGAAGLLLSAVAIGAPWRRAATAAAGVFAGEYALALSLAHAPRDLLPAVAFGLALVVFMQTVDLACRARGATVHAAVLASHAGRSIALAAGSVIAVVLALLLATALAPVLPAPAAPFCASIGALGAIATVARTIARRQGRRTIVRNGDALPTAP